MSTLTFGGLRFLFEIDLESQELRKNGRSVKLPPQAFRLLSLLAAHPSQLVTREEIQRQIWNGDTFVDFEHGINKCIRQIRDTLGDNPDSPKFIETLPRRGYRFIAPIRAADLTLTTSPRPSGVAQDDAERTQGSDPAKPVPAPHAAPKTERRISGVSAPRGRFSPKRLALAASPLVAATLILVLTSSPFSSSVPKIGAITQITNDGAAKVGLGCCNVLVSDGARIYFSEMTAGSWVLGEVSVQGGEVTPFPAPFRNLNLLDIAPDKSRLLVKALNGSELNVPIWFLSLPTGSPQRFGDVLAVDAAWSDSGHIAYSRTHVLYLASGNGSELRKLATLEGTILQPRWSPDQSILRFTIYNVGNGLQSLWEVSADGSNLHPLFPEMKDEDECCGNWTPDGKYFVYQSTRNGVSSIWAFREGRHGLFRAPRPEPVRLTSGPMSFLAPSPIQDGKLLFAIGWQPRGELMRYDSESREFVNFLPGISAEGLDFSRDGDWVAYVAYPEGALWRSRIDGSERLQLTSPEMQAGLPRWSPDGKRIAFMARKPGATWKIHLISAGGGDPEQLIPGAGPEFDAGWSPDGKSVVFADSFQAPAPALHVVEVETRRVSILPGSEGLFSPRWSPDGRFIAALSTDSHKLALFDLTTKTWSELLQRRVIAYPTWSRNGRYIYFCNTREEFTPFYRLRLSDRRLERVTGVNFPRGLTPGSSGWWTGLAPDDSPLLLRDISTQEIYALEWQSR